jgi:signal transduction histidine kinase
LLTRDSVLVDVNHAFLELVGVPRERVVGTPVAELLASLIAPRDRAMLGHIALRNASEARQDGAFWCRVLAAGGVEKPIRVVWRLHEGDVLTLLLDAQPEAFGQEVTEALARVAGSLSRCATETEVLERAVAALAERGFTATALLWDADDPLLRYGPTCSPVPSGKHFDLPRPPKELLTRLNPGYPERRAAFFQDGVRLVREAYPEPVAERVLALLPASRMVQAPLFLGDAPYGALVVTGDALSPLVATALDLFAELVGKALEAVRLRHERVDRERMAALGEAAAVMAHEVRNPVGAIMNALALLERAETEAEEETALLRIIGEESARLAQVVNQLLELGRPLHPTPGAFAVEDLVGRAVRLLASRGELEAGRVELPEAARTLAWLDAPLVELALVNVVRNALQTKDARVWITIEPLDDAVRCVVEDDGPGIPDEVSRRLGQPFVTTRATGTGMGFAVVRRIMEASGGRFLVERSTRGGARVALELPLPPSAG